MFIPQTAGNQLVPFVEFKSVKFIFQHETCNCAWAQESISKPKRTRTMTTIVLNQWMFVFVQFERHVSTNLIAISYSVLKLVSPPPHKIKYKIFPNWINCSEWVFIKPETTTANISINIRHGDSNRVWFSGKMKALSQTTGVQITHSHAFNHNRNRNDIYMCSCVRNGKSAQISLAKLMLMTCELNNATQTHTQRERQKQ